MHPLFRLAEQLPVPAGQSPFHVRGAYFDRLKARAATLPGGLPALRRELKDESVRQFIEQRFSFTGWYDVMPTMPLYVALARLSGQDFESAVREATYKAASQIVPWLFRGAVKLAGPSFMAGRVAKIVMFGDDFTRVSLDHMKDGHGVGAGSGIPLFVAPNVANLVLGFFHGMLEHSGARNVSARYTDVVLDGCRDGFETVTMRYEFTWAR